MADDLIPARETELRRAMLAGDVGALDRLIDDALVFTMPTGTVVGKAADLEAHRTGRLRLTMLEPGDQRVAHYGTAAPRALSAVGARA